MQARKTKKATDRRALGTLKADTKGDFGPQWEASGLQRVAGLSDR